MITKKHLKALGFSVRVPAAYPFLPTSGKGIARRTAILTLQSGNTLYIRGSQLFFVPDSSSIHESHPSLWKQRHLGMLGMSLATLKRIISDCKAGLWVQWEYTAAMQTDLETNLWFGSVLPVTKLL